jgi:hypothetical protein
MYDIFGYLFPNNFKKRQSLIVFRFLVEAQGNFLRLHQLYYKLLVLIIKHSNEYFEMHYCIFYQPLNEATALSADLKKFEETDRAVEVVKPGSPDAIISCNCHGFNIIEIKCLLDVKLVSI